MLRRLQTVTHPGVRARLRNSVCGSSGWCVSNVSCFAADHSFTLAPIMLSCHIMMVCTMPLKVTRMLALQVGILCGVSLLLQVHALYNIVILYPQKMHLTSDEYWYPLSAMPELLVLVPLTWPGLLARVSLSWPPAAEGGDSGKGSDSSSRGPNKRSVVNSGNDESSAMDVV